MYSAKSKKFALVIGHFSYWALGIWNNAMIYLSDHQTFPMSNSQCPKQPL